LESAGEAPHKSQQQQQQQNHHTPVAHPKREKEMGEREREREEEGCGWDQRELTAVIIMTGRVNWSVTSTH